MFRHLLIIVAIAIQSAITPSVTVAQDATTVEPTKKKQPEVVKLESADQLVGSWKFVSVLRDGKQAPDDRLKGRVVITKEKLTLKSDDGDFEMSYELNKTKQPTQITVTITASPFGGEGVSTQGIVQLTNDNRLHLCYAEVGADAPASFDSPKGKTDRAIVFERIEK